MEKRAKCKRKLGLSRQNFCLLLSAFGKIRLNICLRFLFGCIRAVRRVSVNVAHKGKSFFEIN